MSALRRPPQEVKLLTRSDQSVAKGLACPTYSFDFRAHSKSEGMDIECEHTRPPFRTGNSRNQNLSFLRSLCPQIQEAQRGTRMGRLLQCSDTTIDIAKWLSVVYSEGAPFRKFGKYDNAMPARCTSAGDGYAAGRLILTGPTFRALHRLPLKPTPMVLADGSFRSGFWHRMYPAQVYSTGLTDLSARALM